MLRLSLLSAQNLRILTLDLDQGTYRPKTRAGSGQATARVGPQFFRALGTPVIAGRAFHSGDVASDHPVVIVNEAFVERVLGAQNAVGRRVRFRSAEDPTDPWGRWHEIVGVVRQLAMGVDPETTPAGLYFPLKPAMTSSASMAVHVRDDPEAFVPRVRSIAAALDRSLRLYSPRRLDALRAAEAAFYAMWARILIGGSLIVLTLALAGIYSIMSFTVSRRTREIGIRRALGAPRRTIVASILKRPLLQIGAGVLIGVVALLIPTDGARSVSGAIIVLAFTVLMVAVCMLACVVPTRRALRIEPTDELRSEV